MELYLDSVNFDEIKAAANWGFLSGLTTTPTFMHRHGIKDIDAAIVELSGMVPVLQVEALGDTAEDSLKEADRILNLPLKGAEMVFKIPISNEGVRACNLLVKKGHKVNVHLIYTLNQAYLAMESGAAYVCPLVGRMHDQGHDAFALIKQCVDLTKQYSYNTKIMVSSVRHAEHVRQALLVGAQTCTIPWSVMKSLNNNSLTDVGTAQFIEHTQLMTVKVKDAIRQENPQVSLNQKVLDAIIQMTSSKFGAVSVIDGDGKIVGIFTDGDIRRNLAEKGNNILESKMSDFPMKAPITISSDALLYEAANLFSQYKIDCIIVSDNGAPLGMLDVQDLVQRGLMG